MSPVIVAQRGTRVTDLADTLATRSRAKAGIRVIRSLANKPDHRAITAELCREAGVANLSCAVSKIEHHLADLGWRIVVTRPSSAIPNRWGEPSGQCWWALVPLEAKP